MFYTEEQLKEIHKLSFNNKEFSKSGQTKCGCFYCNEIYCVEDVQLWTLDNTAICPLCLVDSVIIENETMITEDLLKQMNQFWFSED